MIQFNKSKSYKLDKKEKRRGSSAPKAAETLQGAPDTPDPDTG